MKKILSWILIVAMLLASVMTMTACDLFGKEVKEEALSQDEVDDLLNAVSAKMEDLDDLEIRDFTFSQSKSQLEKDRGNIKIRGLKITLENVEKFAETKKYIEENF